MSVIFGPNDSGKSNTVRAIRAALGALSGGELLKSADRFHPGGVSYPVIEFALDGLGVPGTVDELLFRQIVQYGAVSLEPDFEWEEEGAPLEATLPPMPATPNVFQVGRYVFDFGYRPRSSNELISGLREGILTGASDWYGTDWADIEQPYAALLDFGLQSRTFEWSPAGGFAPSPGFIWRFPPLIAANEGVQLALNELVALRKIFWAAEEYDMEPEGFDPDDVYGVPVLNPQVRGRWWMDVDRDLWEDSIALFRADPPDRGPFLALSCPCNVRLFDLVEIGGVGTSPTELVERIEDFASRQTGSRSWLAKGEAPWFRLDPRAEELIEKIETEANSLAPQFVRDLYRIRVELAPPGEWGDTPRVRLAMEYGPPVEAMPGQPRDPGRFELRSVGTGVSTWASYAVIEAMRRLERQAADSQAEQRDDYVLLEPEQWVDEEFEGDSLDGASKPPRWAKWPEWDEPSMETYKEWLQTTWYAAGLARFRQTIYFSDEPERNLHPLAEKEVAHWLAAQVEGGHSMAILATHSPEFLDLPSGAVEYFWAHRDDDRLTRLTRLTDDLLGAIGESAQEMGLSPAQAVQLTRAWLVVEGEHDRRVLRHFYGRELDRARVTILPLRGVKEARALLQLGHLSTLGKPLYLLFDSVRASWVTGEPPEGGLPGAEEKVVQQLRRLWADEKVPLVVEPFSLPDIICVLPDPAVQQTLFEAFTGRSAARPFPGWQGIVRAYEAAGSKGRFKEFAFKQIELGADADEFVEEILKRVESEPLVGTALHRSIEHLLADLDERLRPSANANTDSAQV